MKKVILASALFCLTAAHAALFEDDEARRAILDLRKKFDIEAEEIKKSSADIKQFQSNLIEQQNLFENLRNEIQRVRGEKEELTQELRKQQAAAQALSQGIDERLKNIRGEISLDKAIDFVTKVDPIEFTWKEGVDTGLKAGYSAQQTYKAGFEHLIGVVPKEGIPEVVESDGFVSPKDAQFVMNYEQVTPYHSKLIKHLLDKIEQLENRISQLESK